MATIPSIAMIPSGYKANKVYSVLPTDGSGDLDFARTTKATRVNQNGLIEEVAIDVPRLDYMDGSCPSLLLEKSSTNLITQSELFSNSYWTKSGATVTSGFSAPSVDSPLGAFKLVEGSNNGTHILIKNVGSADGTTNTFSLYAKKGERTHFNMYNGTSSVESSTFNLNDGTVINNGTSTSKIELISNGWYKCSVTSINKEKQANVFINDGTTINYQGDGTSGVYIFGSQMEAQSSATSYIKTEGTAITRTADSASKSGISSLINSSEGVLYFEGRTDDSNSTEKNVNLSDGGTQNELKLYFYATSINVTFNINGVNQFYANKTITIGDNYKLAVKFKENDFALWINGIEEVVDSSGIVGVQNLFNKINLSGFFSNTKDLRVYKTILSDAELTTLTTL